MSSRPRLRQEARLFLSIRLDPLRRIAILVELRAPSSFDDGAEDERCVSFQGFVDGEVHP
jgi:hypothetical protein